MPEQTDLWVLFTSAFISSTILPGGSEALLLYYANESVHSKTALWLVATFGNTLGGLTSWGLGRLLRWRFPTKRLDNEKHRLALARIERWGSPLLLLSWLPIVGDPLCVAAGWIRVNVVKALILIMLGKGLRYAAIIIWI